ncbi:MAG: hypothetical protein HY280_09335 [Nitrospinae bacterium]|nr:hypothetical protein [Nitrospinota bacterium]
MTALELFRTLIHQKTGIYFRDETLFSLDASLKKRCGALHCDSLEKYHAQILNDKEEMDALINLITVNETYFLREPSHFKALNDKIFPEILQRKAPGSKVRFLSAGCSTGEEAFSICISLVETHGPAILERIEVFGVDIDETVLNAARGGFIGDTRSGGWTQKLAGGILPPRTAHRKGRTIFRRCSRSRSVFKN